MCARRTKRERGDSTPQLTEDLLNQSGLGSLARVRADAYDVFA